MASGPNAQQVVAETDFLFGLRKSDVRHSNVLTALNMHKRRKLSVKLLSSAVLEARAVLYSRGLSMEKVEDVFSLMASILADNGVEEFVPVELTDVVAAERMRGEEPSLSFFDSLHGAAAKRLNLALLSSEGIYHRLGLQVIDLDKL
jgi:hypothetical protein